MNPSLAILAVLGFPVVIAIASMWRGYVLSILWAWFVVPLFGLPQLSIPLAIGISLIVGMLTNHRTGREVEKKGGLGNAIGLSVFVPALFLLMGWLVHMFV